MNKEDTLIDIEGLDIFNKQLRRELTQIEYDALSDKEKNSNVIFFVTDGVNISDEEKKYIDEQDQNILQEAKNYTNNKIANITYTLPMASEANLGGVKVDGETILINSDGVISINKKEIITAPPALNECTPEQIQTIVRLGLASEFWDIGDKIGIQLNGEVGGITLNDTYYAYIIGFNHNKEIEGNNTIHFQFAKSSDDQKALAFYKSGASYGTSFCMSQTVSDSQWLNSGGWEDCYIRNTVCPAFLAAMPTSWQDVISPCTKYTNNYGANVDDPNNPSYITATQDKIWIPSEYEIIGLTAYSNSAEKNYQQQYTYYKNGNSKLKYSYNDDSTGVSYWTRSPSHSSNQSFVIEHANGNIWYTSAYYSSGFAPCFMIK